MSRRAIGVLALALLGAGSSVAAPSLYEAAVAGTCVPSLLLRAIAIVESSERDEAVGDDGISIGRFQLNKRFRAERVARWGAFDPRDPASAGRIAARILEGNYRRLGTWDLAIAAYRQGVEGVRRDGPTAWYVERVRRAWFSDVAKISASEDCRPRQVDPVSLRSPIRLPGRPPAPTSALVGKPSESRLSGGSQYTSVRAGEGPVARSSLNLGGIHVWEVGPQVDAAGLQIIDQGVLDDSGSGAINLWTRSIGGSLVHKEVGDIDRPVAPLGHDGSIHISPSAWNIRILYLQTQYACNIIGLYVEQGGPTMSAPSPLPVFIPTARDRVVTHYRDPVGRREFQHLLEASDFDKAAAWRQFVARACPKLPARWIDDVIDSARAAIIAGHGERARREPRAAA